MRHPDDCAAYPTVRGRKQAFLDGVLEVHWRSLLHDIRPRPTFGHGQVLDGARHRPSINDLTTGKGERYEIARNTPKTRVPYCGPMLRAVLRLPSLGSYGCLSRA